MLKERTYLGEFWNPNISDSYKYIGALKVSKKGAMELEIHQTTENYCLTHNEGYDVLWGNIGDNYPVTLFNVRFRESQGYSSVSFSVEFVSEKQHIDSLDQPLYKKCTVSFPNLRNWVCSSKVHYAKESNNGYLSMDATNHTTCIESVEYEDGGCLKIWERIDEKYLPYSFHLEKNQYAFCEFEFSEKRSINQYKQLIMEFSQLLSIALYCQQYPNEILFCDDNGCYSELDFVKENCQKPRLQNLIPFNELRKKVPQMIKNWHTNFSQVAPICRYLLQSVRYNSFDFPDFLIIAHALDGYHKRFVNKKNGQNIWKYKDRMNTLLEHFKDVDLIKNNKIDTEVLTQSRDKYSHLIPDEEKPLAVSGQELYDLTQKCKVLLTCCLLDMLGLEISEINNCLNQI